MQIPNFTQILTPESKMLSPPVRMKVEVEWLKDDDTTETFKTQYVADSMLQVIEHCNSKRLRLFPFPVAFRVLGFYVYDCFYLLDDLEDSPLDKEILFYISK